MLYAFQKIKSIDTTLTFLRQVKWEEESDDSSKDNSDESDLGEDGGEDEDTSSISGSENDSDNVPISRTLFDL